MSLFDAYAIGIFYSSNVLMKIKETNITNLLFLVGIILLFSLNFKSRHQQALNVILRMKDKFLVPLRTILRCMDWFIHTSECPYIGILMYGSGMARIHTSERYPYIGILMYG